MQQDHFDMLLVNLRMDSTYVKESMRIKWVSENGIVENITAIVKDFKETRGLLVSSYCCRTNVVSSGFFVGADVVICADADIAITLS